MTSKTFVSGTVIDSAWLNDVNNNIYGPTAPAGTLRGDLAVSSGASLVGYIADGAGAAPTDVQTVLREHVSVDGFYANGVSGAKVDPTGVIDSTLGIEAAIASNRNIFLPPGGVYSVSGVFKENLTNFTIYGGGKLKLSAAANKPVIEIKTSSKFSVSGIVLDGNGTNQTELINRNLGVCIRVSTCTDWEVSHNICENNYSGASILAIDDGSPSVELGTNGRILWNTIKNAGKVGGPLASDGIYANSDNTVVFGNIIDTCTDYGIAGDYSRKLDVHFNNIKNVLVGIGVLGALAWKVTNNTIDTAGQGVSVTLSGNPAVAPYLSDDVQIHSNTIKNITKAASGTPNGDGIFVDTSAIKVSMVGNTITNTFRGIGCDALGALCVGNVVDTSIDRSIYCNGAGSIVGGNITTNGAGNVYGSASILVTKQEGIIEIDAAGGPKFNPTVSAAGTMNGNTIKAYDEATYVPAVLCTVSGTITIDPTQDSLQYTRIGRLVTVTGMLIVQSVSVPSGAITVSLPMTVLDLAESADTVPINVIMKNTVSANINDFVGYAVGADDKMFIYLGTGTDFIATSANQMQATSRIYISLQYITSAV